MKSWTKRRRTGSAVLFLLLSAAAGNAALGKPPRPVGTGERARNGAQPNPAHDVAGKSRTGRPAAPKSSGLQIKLRGEHPAGPLGHPLRHHQAVIPREFANLPGADDVETDVIVHLKPLTLKSPKPLDGKGGPCCPPDDLRPNHPRTGILFAPVVSPDFCKPEYTLRSAALAEADVEGAKASGHGWVDVAGRHDEFHVQLPRDAGDGSDAGRPKRQPLITVRGESNRALARMTLAAPASGEFEHPCGGKRGVELDGWFTLDRCICNRCVCTKHEVVIEIRGRVEGQLQASGQTAVAGLDVALDGNPLGRRAANGRPVPVTIPFQKTLTMVVATGQKYPTYSLKVGYAINNGTTGSAKLHFLAEAEQVVAKIVCLP